MSQSQINSFHVTQKLASYAKWPGCLRHSNYSPIQLVRLGFTYTGERMIVKCDECDNKVDCLRGGVISLSDSHASNCKTSDLCGKKPALSNSLPCINIVNLSQSCRNDMNIYKDLMSIRSAPEICPCKNCLQLFPVPACAGMSKDVFGLNSGSVLNITLTRKTQSRPAFAAYSQIRDRLNSFNENSFDNVRELSEAGFFFEARNQNISADPVRSQIMDRMKGFHGNTCGYYNELANAGVFYEGFEARKTAVSCFHCGLCLCDQIVLHNPWREHARWSPVCFYLQKEKSETFVHDVINDTRMLKRYYKAHSRPKEMKMDIVIDALKQYPQVIIGETIESFFREFGI